VARLSSMSGKVFVLDSLVVHGQSQPGRRGGVAKVVVLTTAFTLEIGGRLTDARSCISSTRTICRCAEDIKGCTMPPCEEHPYTNDQSLMFFSCDGLPPINCVAMDLEFLIGPVYVLLWSVVLDLSFDCLICVIALRYYGFLFCLLFE
jgi:hypothetical protein